MQPTASIPSNAVDLGWHAKQLGVWNWTKKMAQRTQKVCLIFWKYKNISNAYSQHVTGDYLKNDIAVAKAGLFRALRIV